jgi:hypothetical protein
VSKQKKKLKDYMDKICNHPDYIKFLNKKLTEQVIFGKAKITEDELDKLMLKMYGK